MAPFAVTKTTSCHSDVCGVAHMRNVATETVDAFRRSTFSVHHSTTGLIRIINSSKCCLRLIQEELPRG